MNDFLRDYQLEAVKKTINSFKKYRACYNASDMGTGKSVMTCGTINVLKKHVVSDLFILIISPSAMLYTWKKELEKFSGLESVVISKSSELPLKYEPGKAYIISYALASMELNLKVLLGIKWTLCICDEAHYLKNYKANRTKAVDVLSKNVKYMYFLSGTPFINSTVDGYPVFRMCDPFNFKSFIEFAEKYAVKRITPWGTKYEKARNVPELSKKLRESFFIRYRRKDVLKSLPECVESIVYLPKDCGIEVDEATEAAIVDSIRSQKVKSTVVGLRQQIGERKVKAISEYTEDLLEQDRSVILFAHHKAVIAKYKELLEKYNPYIITGDVSSSERQKAIEGYQRGDSKLIIMNIIAGGVGITLTKASEIVFAEFPWTYADYAQAIGRAHRMGQENNVTVYNFIVDGSIDVTIHKTVMEKRNMHDRLINDETHR